MKVTVVVMECENYLIILDGYLLIYVGLMVIFNKYFLSQIDQAAIVIKTDFIELE